MRGDGAAVRRGHVEREQPGASADDARARGAEVVLVKQAPGSTPGRVSGADLALVESRTAALAAERGAFRIDQFVRAGSARAHELHTGPEILRQSGGSVTAFCDFVGSGGTFAGLARAFGPEVRGYIVEPEGASVLAGGAASEPNHRIQGGGYAMPRLPLLDGITPTGFLTVSDEETIATARRLAAEEGIFAGFSSGANVAAALRLLEGPERGGTIAVMICDTGLKYLSTDLWPELGPGKHDITDDRTQSLNSIDTFPQP
jgi:cysteine synthase A